jgi:3-oxoacyl-[acyl-carrier protein] reductase
MDLGLRGKVAWITGASGGIGRALAEVFGEEGAHLVLHGHGNFAALEEWVATQPWGRECLCVPGDVRDPDALARCADLALERFGRLDVCLANAGRWPSESRALDELGPERLRATLEVNLLGALFTARAFFAALRRTGPRPDGHGAALVFTGSTAGRFGERGHVDYAVAKAGLHGAVKTLKNEIVALDPYGRVNAVEPGWTVTHVVRPALDQPGHVERALRTMPLKQLGRARDVARTAAWLASPLAAAHVSGEIIAVSGGMEGRCLWDEGEIERRAVLARVARLD